MLQLTQPHLDRGHVVYCDKFFSNKDLAAYLRLRQTGMVGTSNLTTLPHDLDYIASNINHSRGHLSGSIIRQTTLTTLVEENALRYSCMQKN